MLLYYHKLATQQALVDYFDTGALDEVVAANLAQDSIGYQLGSTSQFHFDNNCIVEGNAFVEDQHTMVVQFASEQQTSRVQRRAFGRLSHAVQDFYAHTNYVELWLMANGGLFATKPDQIDPLDARILNHERLHSGYFLLWRDPFYYIPGLGPWLSRHYLPADSHEAMHLDSPARNPYFDYAFSAAVQRTEYEFQRVAEKLDEAALKRFCRTTL